jgi:carbon-monoxide dehydrogenase medium subunit
MTVSFRPAEYVRPRTVEEASALLADFGGQGAVIAGGTDLLVKKPAHVKALIDLVDLRLDHIVTDGSSEGAENGESTGNGRALRIGASVTVTDLAEAHHALSGPWSMITEAARLLGTPAVRNRATLGGNLCNASPAGDLSVALLALRAYAVTSGTSGVRRIPLSEFFLGPNRTVLAVDEVLMEIGVPATPAGSGAAFLKLGRHQSSVDIATVSVGCLLVADHGVCRDVRISLGAVGPTPVLTHAPTEALVGREFSPALMREAGAIAAADVHPIDDVRASAVYRRKMTAVLVRRALETALREV